MCGGIPIILALRQGLAANRVQELFGILNGTANYILTQMTGSGASYAQALAKARPKGSPKPILPWTWKGSIPPAGAGPSS